MIFSKVIPLGLLAIGIFLLTQVLSPVIAFKVWELGQQINSQLLISPITPKESRVLGISIKNEDNFPAFVSTLSRESRASYKEFSLTIPKIKIDKARVQVDSNDLSENLAHLPGSALPGERGNMFISGHSALSRVLPLKNAFFASLSDLRKGDEILIEANGARFKYQVYETKVVDPKDLSVINAPDQKGRYISLMTCVPPGLNFKRLVVLGRML